MSTESTTTKPRTGGTARFLRDLAIILFAAVLASFLVRTFLVRTFYIPSASMENTLLINDRVIVNELGPKLFGVHRGDIVVFDDPGGWLGASGQNDLIKRVIGLPGDHVSCCDTKGRITVNGVPITEPYVLLPSGQKRVSGTDFSVTVPKGKLWVMGDNRYDSADSRVHGFVPESDVVGRAFVISWPASRWAVLDRYREVFARVPE